MEELCRDGVADTAAVLCRLVDSARETIDLTAMYWNLLVDPASSEEAGLSAQRLADLGADRGRQLYEALEAAARRGVHIRVVQSPGFRDGPQESDRLAAQYPEQVSIRQLHMADWFGSGIMHQKLWLIDGRHFYLGSANPDWKALTQVKELGVVVENCPQLADDAGRQFEALWHFGELKAEPVEAFDPAVGMMRPVPNWSSLLPDDVRRPSPLERSELAARYNRERPFPLPFNEMLGETFITSSPPELCAPGRTADLDGLLYTIQEADRSISISVMDFSPVKMPYGVYDPTTGQWLADLSKAQLVWWPLLYDALLGAAITRGVHVRLLVGQWAYSSPLVAPYLALLQETAAAAQLVPGLVDGRLEVRRFRVPGWDSCLGPERQYPGYTRVSHSKYIVTDNRLNIGTSNMSWDYFAHSVGTSFNTNHPGLVRQLRALFDRDWDSPYAEDIRG